MGSSAPAAGRGASSAAAPHSPVGPRAADVVAGCAVSAARPQPAPTTGGAAAGAGGSGTGAAGPRR
eukprot:8137008-Lingulodinium_polyedra.AAC.1